MRPFTVFWKYRIRGSIKCQCIWLKIDVWPKLRSEINWFNWQQDWGKSAKNETSYGLHSIVDEGF